MKKLLFIGAIISSILTSCVQQQQQQPQQSKTFLEGVWQVVSWEFISEDTLRWKLGVNVSGTEMKIWSENYFNFVGQYRVGDTMINNYGGGTYFLEGNLYQENLTYPNLDTVRLLLEIKEDTIIQKWPCDENWQIDKSNYNTQKLTRR